MRFFFTYFQTLHSSCGQRNLNEEHQYGINTQAPMCCRFLPESADQNVNYPRADLKFYWRTLGLLALPNVGSCVIDRIKKFFPQILIQDQISNTKCESLHNTYNRFNLFFHNIWRQTGRCSIIRCGCEHVNFIIRYVLNILYFALDNVTSENPYFRPLWGFPMRLGQMANSNLGDKNVSSLQRHGP